MTKYVVTGGNRGIGKHIVDQLLDYDHTAEIVIISRNEVAHKDNITWIKADLATAEGIETAKAQAANCDVLINNAGIMIGKNPFDITDEEKQRMVTINQDAVVALSLAAIKNNKEGNQRRIINNASIAAQIGHPDMWYGMTKAAIVNLTKSIAKYHGHEGIICNCVAPSTVNTDMQDQIPEARKEMMKKIAVTGRFAEPEEIAKTMVWLATQSPEYINGACIDINNTIYLR